MTARDLLQALLDGKTITHTSYGDINLTNKDIITNKVFDLTCPNLWTIKPDVILINGIEVSKPCTTLAFGQEYYIVDTSECHTNTPYTYREDSLDNTWLKAGMCHLTKEAADTHLKALLSFTSGAQQ